MTRTIVAYFDTVQAAEQAAYDLGTRVSGVRAEVFDSRTGVGGLGTLPQEDVVALTEGFRRGGGVVHAEVPDDGFEAAADALEASGAVNLGEREAEWRREGWTGAAVTGGGAAPATASAATTASDTASAAAAGGEVRSLDPVTGEEVIPVVEERLRVGKRETAHGRVRVRSYVVETPVREQVTLREERVQVERRPADRPVGAADEALFRERTIEVTETAEEVVVSKEARVTGEVVVRKEVEERTETVEDTVRRTEVEVDDDSTAPAKTPTGATGTPRRDPGAV